MYLSGLIYLIVFENKFIDNARRDELKAEIDAKVAQFRRDEGHKKAPSALKYLKERIDSSVVIYRKYVHEQA
ncbi:MAG: hypothetical protein JWQ54_2030 [Mucilaginibacter sp.]|nr:hypothetical protein [Mucilaginibacter sp.]